MNLNTTITVAGAKGGVGKTTTSINVGAAASADGQRTVVVELDLAMANLTDFLSLSREDSGPTLHDVLAGDAAVQDAVYKVSENFFVTPSGTGLDGYSSVDLDRLPAVLETLQAAFDLVVVDTGAGLSRATVEPLRHADATVLVSTPRVAAVRDTDKTKQLAQRVGTPVCGLVLTKSGTGESPGPDRIAEFLDVDLLGHVPDDEAVPSSQDQGAPAVESEPDSDAASMYRTVAGNLLFRLDTGIHRDDETLGDESEQNVGLDDRTPHTTVARDGGVSTDTAEKGAKTGRPSPVAAIEQREGVAVATTKPEYPPPESTSAGTTVGSPEKERSGAAEQTTSPQAGAGEAGNSAGEPTSDSTTPAITAATDDAAPSERSTATSASDTGQVTNESPTGSGPAPTGADANQTDERSSVLSRVRSVFWPS